MKKLIIFSLVLALAAGVVFAQASVGGNLEIAYKFLGGDNIDKSQIMSGDMAIYNAHANVNFGGADGGGMVRLWSAVNEWKPNFFTFIWWKPTEWLRLQFGQNADGDWGHAQISGWGFNAEAQNQGAIDQYRGIGNGAVVARTAGNAWYGGFSGLGATVSLTPIEGLAINVAIPVVTIAGNDDTGAIWYNNKPNPSSANHGETTAGSLFSKMHINVAYTIQDIGTIRLTTELGPGYNKGDADEWYGTAGTNDPARIWASFYLMAIDDMGLDVGAGFRLPAGEDADINFPVGIGLGFRYASGDFGIKARIGMELGAENKIGGTTVKSDTSFGINILPSYNINANVVGYLGVGLGIVSMDKEVPGVDGNYDSLVDFYVNPYFLVRGANGVRFYAGFTLVVDDVNRNQGGKKDGKDGLVTWSLPLGMRAYF
ncbi:MAG: hypothetical protein LBH97_01535 [Treponema sp.]|nr:hypothetical protein [Treponema sp.]